MQKPVNMSCMFCNEKYNITEAEVGELING
jgi:redox-regulated HSP33 family molecular chaperone